MEFEYRVMKEGIWEEYKGWFRKVEGASGWAYKECMR